MKTDVSDHLVVGDGVFVDSHEGFGGPAVVVAVRDCPGSRCRVRMSDGSQPEFWAHDFELSPRACPGDRYDSRPDTLAHIETVRRYIASVVKCLENRAADHDASKLADPEKAAFDEYTPKLKGSTYGSDEYKGFLAAMKPALDRHYARNRHHPEHHPGGVREMSLIDLLELLCDWKAATERHADGNLAKSIEINQKRFGYSDELRSILTGTAKAMGWV